ncbi:MAG: hypothetical protein ACREN5_15565, partial [Gemmatimonadales bacterium]
MEWKRAAYMETDRLLRALSTLILVLTAAVGPALHAQPPEEPPPPKVSFEEQEVVVSGLAPGSRVAWLSLT